MRGSESRRHRLCEDTRVGEGVWGRHHEAAGSGHALNRDSSGISHPRGSGCAGREHLSCHPQHGRGPKEGAAGVGTGLPASAAAKVKPSACAPGNTWSFKRTQSISSYAW